VTANVTQPAKKAASAPVAVTIDASTGEVDWLQLLAALLEAESDGSAAAPTPGDEAAAAGGSQAAPDTGGRTAESGEEADGEQAVVGIGSASGILADILAGHLQPPDVLNGNADSAWANLRLGELDALPEVVSGHGILSGPGFRTVGLFLYFDENGGGVDGTEMLFAEYRPAAGGLSEIIFF
jgi:hypothetical protein